jgi:MFS family permease
MFQGIGVAMTVPASMAIMATTTEKSTRGGAMGVYSTMRMLGFALGPLLGGFLHVQFGFQSAFYAGFGFVILAAILVQLLVDEQPVPQQAGPAPPFRVIDREIWTASIISLGLATFFMASGYSMMSALENEFNQRLEQTALGFGIAFSAMTFSRLIVQVPLGRLSDVIGRKRLIISGLILMAPATAMLGMVGTTLQLTGLRAVQGVVSAAIAAPAFALAGDLSQAGGEGRQMSVLTTGFFLGIALGPLFAGFLAVYLFELPFILGGAFTLVGAWVVYQFVPETVHLARRS